MLSTIKSYTERQTTHFFSYVENNHIVLKHMNAVLFGI